MKIDRLNDIIEEELRYFLRERVGSKVLSPERLEDKVRNFLEDNYLDDLSHFYKDNYLYGEYILSSPNVLRSPDEDLPRPKKRKLVLPDFVVEDIDWNRFLKRFGWYVSEIVPYKYTHVAWIYPMDNPEVDPPRFVYHVTPKNKLLKIKRKGLVPKKSEKRGKVDDPRIYFTRDWDNALKIKDQLSDEIDTHPPFKDHLAVLKVDTKKIDGKFYKDYEVSRGWSIFTRTNVHPNAITNWENYEYELGVLKKRE